MMNVRMNKKQILTFGTIALLSATTAPRMNAAEAEVKADIDLPKTETRVKTDRDVDVTVRSDREHLKVHKFNKASGLLGMEVRNRDNLKLGEVKDLVMESPSRVSYAVLAVGGVLGIGEKLIALPPSALKPAEDGSNHLILNADKAKIQAAPGFAATAWPLPGDAEIDRFWSDLKATGAPAASERSTRSDIDIEVDKAKRGIKSEVNIDQDRKSRIYTDADKDKKVKIEVDKN